MKIIPKIFFVLVTALFLNMTGFARTYTDDMDNTSTNAVKQYNGFSPYVYTRAPENMPDKTVFMFKSTQLPSAWAQYRVNGATQVVAGVYTHAGTAVAYHPREPQRYMMGIFEDSMDLVYNQPYVQALYCAETNAIYTSEGGAQKQVYHDGLAYTFGDIKTPPRSNLIGYAVNIYYSFDGASFARVQPARSRFVYNTVDTFCYEEFTAQVPSSAKYVRVAINDVTSVPLVGGGEIAKSQRLFTSLASVTVSGEFLELGEQSIVVEEAAPYAGYNGGYDYYDEEYEESSSRRSSSRASSVSSEEKADIPVAAPITEDKETKSSSSAKSSASKFEGTIIAPSKAPRESAPPKTAESKSSSKSEKAPSVLETGNQPADEIPVPEIYQIEQGEGGNNFNKGIVAYIAVMSAAVVGVAALPKKK